MLKKERNSVRRERTIVDRTKRGWAVLVEVAGRQYSSRVLGPRRLTLSFCHSRLTATSRYQSNGFRLQDIVGAELCDDDRS